MALSDFGPNLSLLKHPSNWFLVAFVMALLVFVTYFTRKAMSANG
jgi:hypothetical protein